MAKLGTALMVLGGLMFFAFFFGIAFNIATPGDVHNHKAFRDNMDRHSRVAGTSFAVSAAGMIVGIAGAVMVAMSQHERVAGLVEEAIDEVERAETCAHCGATLRRRAAKCASCGAPV